ncbi:MAG: ATP-binding protein [Anaerolineae bacterium]|nr:ATP-binding protein [Gloeobacterales cyanobacterium ES-bin-313]
MKTNPGGSLSPSEVVGRDALIKQLWRALEKQSVVLSAERRMGKTSIIKKMHAESAGKLTVYQDLEKVGTPREFVESIVESVEERLSTGKRVAEGFRSLLQNLHGAEVSGIKLPEVADREWKVLLVAIIKDLVAKPGGTVYFFWDELPLMLYKIQKNSGETVAMEILDTLRSLRQTYPLLRMVYTGSIGLHNVLTSLKRAGYANAPINDMKKIDVPALQLIDAENLALQLIMGENIQVADPQIIAKTIAQSVDGIAFYVQHVVDRLANWQGTIEAKTIKDIVSNYLCDAQDPLDMRYFQERIKTYYLREEVSLAYGLLDILSTETVAISFGNLANKLASRMAIHDLEAIRSMVELLQLDHYIQQNPEGNYAFRFPLIQRYWKLNRGLSH